MVAFRSSATDTNTNGVDETSIVITKPAGTSSGDLLVAVVAGYLPGTLTAPSGWSLMYGPVADGTGLYSWLYQKVAGGSEPANYTWTWSGVGGAINGSITAFSQTKGIDGFEVAVYTTTDPAVSAEVTVSQDSLVYDVYCWRDTTANTCTSSVGTERFDVQAKDVGTIVRGQAGYTRDSLTSAGEIPEPNSINPTNSVERGIIWTIAVSTVPTAEAWDTDGFAVEMDLNGFWTDVTTEVRAEQQIAIRRGASSEGSVGDTSQLAMTLDNTFGHFSPRNPEGQYYGSIGRNTPVRVSKTLGTVGLHLQGEDFDRIRTIGTSALNISGDLDIRIDLEPRSWRQGQTLAGKGGMESGGFSWIWMIDDKGYLQFIWYDTLFTHNTRRSTVPVPQAVRQAVRVTLDINNGAAGHDVKFYTSDTIAGSWTQLGSTVTTSGVTTLTTSPGALEIGMGTITPLTYGNTPLLNGIVYHFELRTGIAGTLVSDVDFTAQTNGTKSFTENSNLWICLDNAVITNRRYRFYGEISEWPGRWDSTGSDVYVPIEGSGIMRRLSQGESPAKSALYRYHTSDKKISFTTLDTLPLTAEAYWPMEDGEGSRRVASGLANKPAMSVVGNPTFASYDGFRGSASLPELTTGSRLKGSTPGTTSGGFIVTFLMSMPAAPATGSVIMDINCSGTIKKFELSYAGVEELNLRGYDADGVQVFTSSNFAVPVIGDLNLIKVYAYQNGVDVDYEVYSREVSSITTTLEVGATVTTDTVGRVTSVSVNPEGALNGQIIGHVAVYSSVDAHPVDILSDEFSAFNAYNGEDATSRAKRLCLEEGLEYRHVGDTSIFDVADITTYTGDGVQMGYQLQKTILELLRECEDADRGILYEPREIAGLGYRSRSSLYDTAARLELDYSAYELSGELLPVEDDSLLRNDVTVTREGGSSGRIQKLTGMLSVAAPPNGVGRYDEAVTISLYEDDEADNLAGWLVHTGTVDEARYPAVTIALENPRFVASSALTEAALKLDIGDRITIDNMPSWMPPEPPSLIVVGYQETFDNFVHGITYVCRSETPYQIAVLDSSEDTTTSARAGSTTSTLAASVNSINTTLSVAISSGALWSTTASDFDIIVNGERMTVTSVSGSSSPQSFAVTRSVNGITRLQAADSIVKLFKPAIVAL